MVILDFSQIAISNFFRNREMLDGDEEEAANMLRHLILNAIRAYIVKYKAKYGDEIVIAVDSEYSWRKDVFPHYKAHRSKDQSDDDIDWGWLFGVINDVVEALDTIFPYKMVKVPHAEADDIIGVLTKHYHKYSPVMIISSDGDFKQLQKYPGVSQFSPIQKKEVKDESPEISLREKIFRGDKGDGIPNFMSPNTTFIDGMRQKPIKSKDIEKWLEQPIKRTLAQLPEEAEIGFWRNDELINLDNIPDCLENRILQDFQRETQGSMSRVLSYFTNNRMKELAKSLDEFKP